LAQILLIGALAKQIEEVNIFWFDGIDLNEDGVT
jgi:hypothetical protein